MNCLKALTVGLVIFLILSIGAIFSLLILAPLLARSLVWTAVAVPFALIYLLLGASYFKVLNTPPGQPPAKDLAGQEEDARARTQAYQRLKESCNQTRRMIRAQDELAYHLGKKFCKKCDRVKPVRCHHCSACGKCVLRMDHHCPWVGNCVGERNHKHFLLFLLYASGGLLVVVVVGAIDYGSVGVYNLMSSMLKICWGVTWMMSLLLELSIGFLLVSQVIQFNSNLTTLQSFSDCLVKAQPFDRGHLFTNLEEVMGPLDHKWLIPKDPLLPYSPLTES